MKPVELVESCLLNSTPRDGLVLDPFLGSGSTLLAAERQGRRCCGLELDAGYCDVVVDRWERFTGKEAIRGEAVEANA
jgi:DNA modification methylase